MTCGERSFGSRRLPAIAEWLSSWLVGKWGQRRGGQAITTGLVLLLAAGLTMTSSSFVRSQSLLTDSSKRPRTLEEAYAALSSDARLMNAEFLERATALQQRLERHQATIVELTAADASLQDESETSSIAEERDAARELADDVQQAIAGVEDLLAAMAEERKRLRRHLLMAEARLGVDRRDAGPRVQLRLRWRLARVEDELERLRRHRDGAQLWLKNWVLGSVQALEEVLDQAGVDIEKLIARAANRPLGQGGPLQVAAPEDITPDALAADDPISGEFQRLALLQRIARTIPLAPPLDQFHVTSHYGKRRDPFTKTWAYHGGLDFGAPRNARVLATAPGQVIGAGPSGPYGNMVEIDHGMGIVSRYAHLKSVAVEVGEAVAFRQAIGVIGSTGRSTSRHLHYEIWIDDRAFDPAKFLDAGRLVVGIFDASGGAEAE